MGGWNRNVNVERGKQGFQPSTRGAAAPRPVAATVRNGAGSSTEPEAGRQGERLTTQLQRVRLGNAADRLLGGGDLLREGSGYVAPNPADEQGVVDAARHSADGAVGADGTVRGRSGDREYSVVSGTAGHVVWTRDVSGAGRHTVGVVESPARDYRNVMMTVTTTNEEEAQRLFNAASREAGLMPEH